LKRSKKYFSAILILSSFFLQYCASIGPLEGGPKDEDPPIFLGSDPIKFATNTQPDKIILEFDEFIVFKSPSENFIVSPPLNEKPKFKLKGKRLQVKNDKDILWEENTTYTYFFGDAICDLHEENPLHNFEYVFSTGDLLDSLSIRGKVLDAKTLLPQEGAIVALYKYGMNDTIEFDSLPYFVRPYYIAKTNELGEYLLNNLRMDDYFIIAIKDLNTNYYFDIPTEEIAFVDSLINPQLVYEFIPDSIALNPEDSVLMDSLWEFHSETMVKEPIHLFTFLQDDSIPQLLETNVVPEKKIELFFKFPVRDTVILSLIEDSSKINWFIPEFSNNRDSLTIWLTDIPEDTVEIALNVDTLLTDTLQFVLKEIKTEENTKRKRKKRKDKEKTKQKTKEESINYTTNSTALHDFYKPLKINFETPLVYANFEFAEILEDSIPINVGFRFVDDLKKNLLVEYNWEENTKYNLHIPSGALRDIFDVSSDSINLSFTTTEKDSYGNMTMDIQFQSLFEAPMLIQLVKGEAEQEKIIHAHKLNSDSTLQINNIAEGNYYLKAIEDKNKNDLWNSGHFGHKIDAEKVFYFPYPISIKASWEIEDKWVISTEDRKRPKPMKSEKDEAENN
jgi:hypothetical protein